MTATPAPAPNLAPDLARGPASIPADQLSIRLHGRRVTVSGLVILRQRPGTAKGVIFITLEDETGTVNVIVWRALYERFRRAVIAGRLLRVTGRLQVESGVMHVIAERVEDLSPLLDRLLETDGESPPKPVLPQNRQTG